MIVGVDFSLTATGVCAITDGDAECATITSTKEEHWDGLIDRVLNISAGISSWARPGPDDVVVIESPAYMARSSSLDRLFGGWWMLVQDLRMDHGAPLLVTPTQLKKFATGRGNAGKDEVLLAVARRYPDVEITDNNQADAVVLAAIGAAVMGEPFNQSLTKVQTEIVEAVRLGRKEK